MATKRAGDFFGNFNFLSGRTAREEGGINTRKNFIQRQSDRPAVVGCIKATDEETGTTLTKFAKSDFNRAEGKLADDDFQRDIKQTAGCRVAHEFCLQIHGQ